MTSYLILASVVASKIYSGVIGVSGQVDEAELTDLSRMRFQRIEAPYE